MQYLGPIYAKKKKITCLSEIQSQLSGHLVFHLINPAGQPEDTAPS